MTSRWSKLALAFCVLALIAALYWPITRGGFIWDDAYLLHDEARLHASDWWKFMFHGFSVWVSYFRPFGVLLFIVEAHVFNIAPEPMHWVSLGMHLGNTALVGLLANNLQRDRNSVLATLAAMLCYGLHPALIEPVSWVGCQCEPAVSFFMLLGLLLNVTIRPSGWRALGVATCFLVALGFIEAAAVFPLLLVVLDLAIATPGNLRHAFATIWQRQRWTYVATAAAAAIYITTRFHFLGYAVSPSALEPWFSISRVQKICATYLHYWNLVIWPMSDIGPIHPFDPIAFERVTLRSAAVDLGAVLIAAIGIWMWSKRRPIGTVIAAVTISLLPVLNLVPVALSESLYHDRYAAVAIAMACILLPQVSDEVRGYLPAHARVGFYAFAAVWFGFAALNVTTTVPLWADEIRLWQWALREHPQSIDVKSHLLATYIDRNLRAPARELADSVVASDAPCPYCLLNAADVALADQDEARAARALDKAKNSTTLARDPRLLRGFVLDSGRLLELQGDHEHAASAYREAIRLEPLDPLPHMALATLLARQRNDAAARAEAAVALPLFAPEQRETWRLRFEQALSESGAAQ